jgi:hypothetical protein
MPKIICLTLLSLCAFTYASCKFNPNLQGMGTANLQGSWVEDSVAYQDQRLQYSKHDFRFTCDSIYITIKTFARVNTYADTCFNNGSWTEYAKGTYQTKQDTLILTTTFTKSDFKQKISGCYRTGEYLPVFLIKKINSTNLYLESLQDHAMLKLSLRKRTVCNPKPLN